MNKPLQLTIFRLEEPNGGYHLILSQFEDWLALDTIYNSIRVYIVDRIRLAMNVSFCPDVLLRKRRVAYWVGVAYHALP